MIQPDGDLDAVRSRPVYRAYLRAWRTAALGVLLLALTGALTAAGAPAVVLTLIALPGAALAAGGFVVAIGCTVALLPHLGSASPRRQMSVIRMVLRDLVRRGGPGRAPRTPPLRRRPR